MKFKFYQFIYCLCFRLHLYKVCGRIYPRLMKSLGGFVSSEGFTVL